MLTVLRVAVADRHPAAEGIMERTARMCPRTLAARVGLRMDGSLTIIHLKMYASMVVEQAVEPPMGKTENPAATVRRRLAEQGRPLMYPNAGQNWSWRKWRARRWRWRWGRRTVCICGGLWPVRITGRYLDHEGRRIGGERVSWFKWRAGRCNPVFWSEKKTGFRPDPG